MASLWDIITSNSTLTKVGNSLWDHLNNQNKGSGNASNLPPVIYGETLAVVEEDLKVVYDENIEVVLDTLEVSVLSEETSNIAE